MHNAPEPPDLGTSLTHAFTTQIKAALEHFHDTAYLEQHSPLATPYLLGEHLVRAQEGSIQSRGKVLQRVLVSAILMLEDHGAAGAEQSQDVDTILPRLKAGSFDQRLLYWQYLHQTEARKPTVAQILSSGYLGVKTSRATYYRRLEELHADLGEVLLQRLRPALRLERPEDPVHLVGREESMRICQEAFHQRATVALTGAAGIGKTALGAALARSFSDQQVFWLTLRPDLSDQLISVLFLLGAFFQQRGASLLWSHLVANQQALDPEVALSLARRDVHTLEQQPPLLCFDELDRLYPATSAAHAQIVSFIAGLRGSTPLLLIGHQVPIEPDILHPLAELSAVHLRVWADAAGYALSAEAVDRLQRYTHGNPRLVMLCLSLYQDGAPLDEILQQVPAEPRLELVLNRIWKCMQDTEKELLAQLAPFRRYAPAYVWPPATLHSLVERGMVQRDQAGGVMVHPAFRTTLASVLPPEVAEMVHLQAAKVRAAGGEYTAAAYHLIQSNRPAVAVQLWWVHRRHEINQGQGTIALDLFEPLPLESLEPAERDVLILARSELRKLRGMYVPAINELARDLWHNPVLHALGERLKGDIYEVTGDLDQAIRAYHTGLQTIARLALEHATFHKNQGWIHMRQQNFPQAWQETLLAQYELEILRGDIKDETGEFATAATHYQTALHLAESLHDKEREAKAHGRLAGLLALQGVFATAENHVMRATEQYEYIGRINLVGSMLINRALLYNLAERYQEALACAQQALQIFRMLGEPYGQAAAGQNIAEACLGLGQLAAAWEAAEAVIHLEDEEIIPDALRTQGEIQTARQAFSEAAHLIQQSIALARKQQRPYLEAYGWRALGKLWYAQGNRDEAVRCIRSALDIFAETMLPYEAQKTHQLLAAWTTRQS